MSTALATPDGAGWRDLWASCQRGLELDPVLTVAEWADEYRWLSGKASSEPGKWRTSRTPYLGKIMEALSASAPFQRVVFAKGSQIGAPLAIDTPIPTVDGWRSMGSISVGDSVFDENGKPCRVTYVSPIYLGRECFRITFSDGASIVSDGEHRWRVDDERTRHRRVRVVTTEEIAAGWKRKRGSKSGNRYAIPVTNPLTLPEAELPISPYAFGVWLGDGNSMAACVTTQDTDAEEMASAMTACGHTTTVTRPVWVKGHATILKMEPTVRQDPLRCPRGHLLSEVGTGVRASGKKPCKECCRQSTKQYAYGGPLHPNLKPFVRDPVCNQDVPGFFAKLRAMNQIGNKHIPQQYLRASERQRWELLQGLMDTDGSVTKGLGRCEFSGVSETLVMQVAELLTSLGLKPSIYLGRGGSFSSKRGPDGKRGAILYRLSFMAYADQPVFRLRRKQSRLKQRHGCRTSETFRRRIVKVERVPSVPVRCIGVDSESHLYLASRAMIATHNTELGLTWIGYIVHQVPGPMMVVSPTVDLAKRLSKQRLDALIDDTPCLRGKVKDPRARDSGNTVLMKEFPGGVMVLTGANSGVGLRSMPARYLMLDEVDGYPASADDEGDPVQLAQRAQRTFGRRKKIYMNSTPLVTGTSRIERELEACDQKWLYHVPCPACQAMQPLVWEQIRYPEGQPEQARYQCRACEHLIENHQKTWMLEHGAWVAEWNRGEQSIGFHLSALYSPVGWFSWAECAVDYEKAKDDPQLLRPWMNTVLGLSFQEKSEAPDWRRLYERRETYRQGVVPSGVAFLTGAADVQKGRIEYEIKGWNRYKESWSVEYGVLEGDIADAAVWAKLDEVLRKDWPCADGATLPLRVFAVDSGYESEHVYAWARKYPQPEYAKQTGRTRCRQPRTVAVVKGVESGLSIVRSATRADLGGKRALRIFLVSNFQTKSELYGWLRLDAPTDEERAAGKRYPGGYCHVPQYGEEYFKQLTSETVITKMVKGFPKRTFQLQKGLRNEALDCFDGTTEVLTRRGWVFWPEVSDADEFATVNKVSDVIEYQRASQIIRRPYVGYMVSFRSGRLDMLVTPGHRMWVSRVRAIDGKKQWSSGPDMIRADEVKAFMAIKTRAKWRGSDAPITVPAFVSKFGRVVSPEVTVDRHVFAALLGWFFSEGWTQINWNSKRGSFARKVGIAQTKAEGRAALRELLPKLPWKFREDPRGYITTQGQLYEYLRPFKLNSRLMRLPEWLLDSSPQCLDAFLDAYIAGDGWTDNHGHRTVTTICELVAGQIQECFMKAGRNAVIRRRPAAQMAASTIRGREVRAKSDQFNVSEIRTTRAYLYGKNGKSCIGKEPFSGVVYCATVPNDTLIVRRNGKAAITGNCAAYNRAAAELFGMSWFDERHWRDVERARGIALEPPPASDADAPTPDESTPARPAPTAPPPAPPTRRARFRRRW